MDGDNSKNKLALIPASNDMGAKMDLAVDATYAAIKAILTEARHSIAEKEKMAAHMSELQGYEATIRQIRDSYEKLETYGNISSPEDLIANYPLSLEYTSNLRDAIHNKVDTLIAQFPELAVMRPAFNHLITKGIGVHFNVDTIQRVPALLYSDIMDFIEQFDLLRNRTALSFALMEFRAKNKYTHDVAAKIIGVSKTAISSWERGHRPAKNSIGLIAKTLGKPALSVICMAESKPSARIALSTPQDKAPPAEDIAQQLLSARQRKGQTQKMAAQKIGVTDRTYQRWESGEHIPTPRYMRAVRLFVKNGSPKAISHNPQVVAAKNIIAPEEIKRAREAKNLTTEEAAGLLNVHPYTFRRWERGRHIPCAEHLPILREFVEASTGTTTAH